jgi:hypothetical protein
MGKKNNFRKTWRTLTELGQEFGVSPVKFGNLLKQHGLRERDGSPTPLAEEGGFFEKITPSEGKPYYLWHHDKTVDYLVRAGVEKKLLNMLVVKKLFSVGTATARNNPSRLTARQSKPSV